MQRRGLQDITRTWLHVPLQFSREQRAHQEAGRVSRGGLQHRPVDGPAHLLGWDTMQQPLLHVFGRNGAHGTCRTSQKVSLSIG